MKAITPRTPSKTITSRTRTSPIANRCRPAVASHNHHVWEHVIASGFASILTYPLWRATAMVQSGFVLPSLQVPPSLFSTTTTTATTSALSSRASRLLAPYAVAASPPYKGLISTVTVMTFGRFAIFWGSDTLSTHLRATGPYPNTVSTALPPVLISTLVVAVNLPIVRAAILLQNPKCPWSTVPEVLRHIYLTHGVSGLWRGTSAGLLKVVPKFTTALVVKNALQPKDGPSRTYNWRRAATTSTIAAVAGAVLTNPFDVVRNQMFVTNQGLIAATQQLWRRTGWYFVIRGLGPSLVGTAIPLALTMIWTDALIQWSSNMDLGGMDRNDVDWRTNKW